MLLSRAEPRPWDKVPATVEVELPHDAHELSGRLEGLVDEGQAELARPSPLKAAASKKRSRVRGDQAGASGAAAPGAWRLAQTGKASVDSVLHHEQTVCPPQLRGQELIGPRPPVVEAKEPFWLAPRSETGQDAAANRIEERMRGAPDSIRDAALGSSVQCYAQGCSMTSAEADRARARAEHESALARSSAARRRAEHALRDTPHWPDGLPVRVRRPQAVRRIGHDAAAIPLGGRVEPFGITRRAASSRSRARPGSASRRSVGGPNTRAEAGPAVSGPTEEQVREALAATVPVPPQASPVSAKQLVPFDPKTPRGRDRPLWLISTKHARALSPGSPSPLRSLDPAVKGALWSSRDVSLGRISRAAAHGPRCVSGGGIPLDGSRPPSRAALNAPSAASHHSPSPLAELDPQASPLLLRPPMPLGSPIVASGARSRTSSAVRGASRSASTPRAVGSVASRPDRSATAGSSRFPPIGPMLADAARPVPGSPLAAGADGRPRTATTMPLQEDGEERWSPGWASSPGPLPFRGASPDFSEAPPSPTGERNGRNGSSPAAGGGGGGGSGGGGRGGARDCGHGRGGAGPWPASPSASIASAWPAAPSSTGPAGVPDALGDAAAGGGAWGDDEDAAFAGSAMHVGSTQTRGMSASGPRPGPCPSQLGPSASASAGRPATAAGLSRSSRVSQYLAPRGAGTPARRLQLRVADPVPVTPSALATMRRVLDRRRGAAGGAGAVQGDPEGTARRGRSKHAEDFVRQVRIRGASADPRGARTPGDAEAERESRRALNESAKALKELERLAARREEARRQAAASRRGGSWA